MNEPIALLNTTIITGDGVYSCQPIGINEVKVLCRINTTVSFIGHQGTADAMSTLLDIPVGVNRSQYKQDKTGMKAVCLKVRGRIPEGKILTIDELNTIGYDFFLLERVGDYVEEADITKKMLKQIGGIK